MARHFSMSLRRRLVNLITSRYSWGGCVCCLCSAQLARDLAGEAASGEARSAAGARAPPSRGLALLSVSRLGAVRRRQRESSDRGRMRLGSRRAGVAAAIRGRAGAAQRPVRSTRRARPTRGRITETRSAVSSSPSARERRECLRSAAQRAAPSCGRLGGGRRRCGAPWRPVAPRGCHVVRRARALTQEARGPGARAARAQ